MAEAAAAIAIAVAVAVVAAAEAVAVVVVVVDKADASEEIASRATELTRSLTRTRPRHRNRTDRTCSTRYHRRPAWPGWRVRTRTRRRGGRPLRSEGGDCGEG